LCSGQVSMLRECGAAFSNYSPGPRTAAGRMRCAAARTIHGHETRAKRRLRSQKMAELMQLEYLMVELGMFAGPRTRGRRPGG